jgi:hypothetical protein
MLELFALLDKVKKGGEFVLRDDQYGFTETLDAVKTARARGTRFNLLDTGRFSVPELEWLCEAGAHFYTSDEARPDVSGLRLIPKACAKGGSSAAFLVCGPFESGDQSGRPFYSLLLALAGDGFILHTSNREHARDLLMLSELAEEAHKGKGSLVYYHHGAADVGLVELAARGARILLSDKRLQESDLDLLNAVLEASDAGGSRLILYVEKGMPLHFLNKLFDAGATLLFKTPPNDRYSLLGRLELKARKRVPNPDAYYLNTAVLL